MVHAGPEHRLSGSCETFLHVHTITAMLSRTAPIRTFVRLGASSPLKLAPKYAVAPFSKVALQRTFTPYQQCSFLLRNQKNTRIGQIRVISLKNLPPTRFNSTTTASNSTAAATSTTAASESQLTWNRFLALRKQRRRISLLSSISCTIICLVGGATFIVSQDVEKFGAQIYGFDTMMVLGLATLAFGLTGWLLGPFLGNAVFNMWHRRLRNQIAMVSYFC